MKNMIRLSIFYNKYAGQKKPSMATNAMCFLKDGLDAADTIRFPVNVYGKADRGDTIRYKNIPTRFANFGARQEDPITATLGEFSNLAANGTNDVGWDVFPGNYERYLHQLTANETSIGYWNVQAHADSNAIYGKYARGINARNTKNALYFDVDSLFLDKAPINGKYPIVIDITYLDSGFGGFRLFYDAKTSANKPSVTVTLANTNVWKKASVTLYDAYFGNRAINRSDFYIQAINNQNTLFSIVELARPDSANPKIGLFTSGSLLFDTVCTRSEGSVRSFVLNGYFLDGSNIVINPLQAYSYSITPDGPFTDSLIIVNYGTGLSKTIYVKFMPLKTGIYSGDILISGGGNKARSIAVRGIAINSRPVLTANISNVRCTNAGNGAVDLVVTGGKGPFSYSWTADSFPFKSTSEDLTGLRPANYYVSVNSFGGCVVTANYIITQPDPLSASIQKDSDIVCRGSTTTVTVSAFGGTIPYTGVGKFTVSSGNISFVVTDANGCTSETDKIIILPGVLVPPSRPNAIIGNDSRGLCGGGTFYYVASNVFSATSYAWVLPSGTTIKKMSTKGDSIALVVPVNFIEDTLSVTANNVCGASFPASKMLTALPQKPVGIIGPLSVLVNQTGLIYSVVNPISGLTYTWSSSNGTRITGGQNTWQSTITWGSTDGKVSVKANNNCGSSAPAVIDVTVVFAALQNAVKTKEKTTGNIESNSIIIMPNPAHTFAVLGFNAEKAGMYEMELTDAAGKILLRKKGIAVAGKNVERINMQPYRDGLYFITLVNRNSRVTLKIIRN